MGAAQPALQATAHTSRQSHLEAISPARSLKVKAVRFDSLQIAFLSREPGCRRLGGERGRKMSPSDWPWFSGTGTEGAALEVRGTAQATAQFSVSLSTEPGDQGKSPAPLGVALPER